MKRKQKLILLGVAGILVGEVTGYFFAYGQSVNENLFQDFPVAGLQWLLRCLLLLLLGISFYYFSLSRKTYSQYQAEEDDEQADSLYKKAFVSFDLATILYNVTLALGLLMIGISLYLLNESHYLLFLLDYLLFMSLHLILPVYKKTLKLLRNYDLPLMALPKDALDLVNSYDEGEKQVSFEENYKIVFRLNQIILPIFYILAFSVSAVTQQFQWFAFLVIVAIHIYINIAQYKATKRYYQ